MIRALTLCALALPTAALGQDGFDAHGFPATPGDGDLHDLLTTWRPENQHKGSYAFGGLFEFAKAPLVLMQEQHDGSIQRQVLLDNVVGLNLSGQYAVHERIGIAASLPVFLASTGPEGAQGVGLGDFRLHVPVTLLGISDDDGGIGLSVIPFADVPIGAQPKFLGNGGFGGGGIVAAGYGIGPIRAALNAGVEVNPSMDLENLRGGAQLLSGLGVSWAAADWLAVRGEANLRPSLSSNRIPMAESPSELLLSARGRYDRGLSWTGGAATALTRGASAAAWRLFFGVGYVYGKDGQLDTDGDGIADRDDACIEEPETVNGYEDLDGCPDMLGSVGLLVLDPDGAPMAGVAVLLDGEPGGTTDEAGRFDLSDVMPGRELTLQVQPEAGVGYAPTELVQVTVEPGGQERDVRLAWLPGRVLVRTRADGAVIANARVLLDGPVPQGPTELGEDGEELFILAPGDWRLLVAAPTFGTERVQLTVEPDQLSLVVIEVTLEPEVVQITESEVIILDQVHFEFDKAVVSDDSMALLTEVANNLLAHPQIAQVEIQGHTDSKGGDRYNEELSQRRVEAVVELLVGLGVPAARLTPKGYGEACAIDTNGTDEGRANNRRVQFIITDPVPASGIPCRDGAPARRAQPVTIERTVTVPAGGGSAD